MYQGTNPAAILSQRRIAEAMTELLAARPYDAVSVAALCRAAGVSRQTFYSLFRSRENVITYLLQMDSRDTTEVFADLDAMLRALCRNFSYYVVRKEPVLRLLAENDLLDALRRLLYSSIMRSDYFRGYVRPELQSYTAGYVAAGLTSVAAEFLCTGADPDTLEEVAYALVRGDIFNK